MKNRNCSWVVDGGKHGKSNAKHGKTTDFCLPKMLLGLDLPRPENVRFRLDRDGEGFGCRRPGNV
jgi:hypothetical protein